MESMAKAHNVKHFSYSSLNLYVCCLILNASNVTTDMLLLLWATFEPEKSGSEPL